MTKTHVHDLSNVPLRRRGTTLEVANAILFLSSEMGSYITGTTLDVNGGVYMN
jgi:3-oxoacyl-[acyl-carrier protein] reductase